MQFRISRRSMVKLLGSALVGVTSNASGAFAGGRKINSPDSWVVFYGENIEIEQLTGYDVIVLDPGFQGSIRALNDAGSQTFGYLSLGEVELSGSVFPLLKEQSVVLDENKNWPGSHMVDVRNLAWKNLIIEEVIPSILSLGFTGLFFDTLDNPPYLEDIDRSQFKGMRAAAIELVKAIRQRYPHVPLIMNRGYELLADVHGDIDAIVAESLLTGYNSKTESNYLNDKALVDQQLQLLKPAMDRPKPLPVLSLDYWDPEDANGIRELYKKERALGHVPYVTTRPLDEIIPEPGL